LDELKMRGWGPIHPKRIAAVDVEVLSVAAADVADDGVAGQGAEERRDFWPRLGRWGGGARQDFVARRREVGGNGVVRGVDMEALEVRDGHP
jgi:hypothetical protein